jgi:hypothetical protein
MTAESGEQGLLTLASDFFHRSQPVKWFRWPPLIERLGDGTTGRANPSRRVERVDAKRPGRRLVLDATSIIEQSKYRGRRFPLESR